MESKHIPAVLSGHYLCRCEFQFQNQNLTKTEKNGIVNLQFKVFLSLSLGTALCFTSTHSSQFPFSIQHSVTGQWFCNLDYVVCVGKLWILSFLTLTANKDNLPELTATQKNKLKHLTIVSLASRMKVKYTMNDSRLLFVCWKLNQFFALGLY